MIFVTPPFRIRNGGLFCYIGNCFAIAYIAKKALRANDAHSRELYMSLSRPHSAQEFRKRNSI